MKASNGAVILILFCAVIFAVCWFTITALTTPARALACGAALAFFAGVFLWFAPSNRTAIARGIIALGATVIAAPLAAVEAVTNDFLFSVLDETSGVPNNFVTIDALLQRGWSMAAIGGAIGVILIIVGGVMHRTPRSGTDGGAE